jgi:hypothetical protein
MHLLYDTACNTPTIPIHRGTLQGDTLSPFLFTIFMEPLLIWLSIGSRGYKPKQHPELPESIHMKYDGHGYADDISITTRTLENLKKKETTLVQRIH